MWIRHAFLVALVLVALGDAAMWQEKWFDQMPVDHFSFGADNFTFRMRYLINTTSWTKGGPILFYAGNEGDITLFAQNTGLMFDIAPEFHGMILFAEHRYYGETMPFGKDSFSRENVGFLSSEQALADFAVFLRWLKGEIDWAFPSPYAGDAKDSPVVVFGGSYGGMLAAWMRMKYPNVVVGALASSAPMWQLDGLTPCYVFPEIVTRTFANSAPGCDDVVRKSWLAMYRLAQTSDGIDWLNENFKFCPNSTVTITKGPRNVYALFVMVSYVWSNMAMVDYPYPSNFLRAVPGYPVKVACERMVKHSTTDDKSIVSAIINGLDVYQNYTGDVSCYQIDQSSRSVLEVRGINYQQCTEHILPMCETGTTDMFFRHDWNFTQYSEACLARYGTRPRVGWTTTSFWGKDLSAASNIIFSNGYLDPWSGGGVTRRTPGMDDSVVLIEMPSGAHHLDLRFANRLDPLDVTTARLIERALIKCWITHPVGYRGCTEGVRESIKGANEIML